MISKVAGLAPAGTLKRKGDVLSEAFQAIADARSRINGGYFRLAGLRLAHSVELGNFLRRLAARPARIPDGNYYGLERPSFGHLFDHIRLYNRNGRAYAAIFHPDARLSREDMKELADWAAQVGLDVCVDADSEYYPGVTLRIVLYREGTEFPATDFDVKP